MVKTVERRIAILAVVVGSMLILLSSCRKVEPPTGLDESDMHMEDAGSFINCINGDATGGICECEGGWALSLDGETCLPEFTAQQVTAGQDHTCAIKPDSTVACWGENESGEAMAPTGTFTQIAAGEDILAA